MEVDMEEEDCLKVVVKKDVKVVVFLRGLFH
jgi:hypothetical protein